MLHSNPQPLVTFPLPPLTDITIKQGPRCHCFFQGIAASLFSWAIPILLLTAPFKALSTFLYWPIPCLSLLGKMLDCPLKKFVYKGTNVGTLSNYSLINQNQTEYNIRRCLFDKKKKNDSTLDIHSLQAFILLPPTPLPPIRTRWWKTGCFLPRFKSRNSWLLNLPLTTPQQNHDKATKLSQYPFTILMLPLDLLGTLPLPLESLIMWLINLPLPSVCTHGPKRTKFKRTECTLSPEHDYSGTHQFAMSKIPLNLHKYKALTAASRDGSRVASALPFQPAYVWPADLLQRLLIVNHGWSKS